MALSRLPELDESLGFNLDRVAQLFRLELVHALAPFGLTPEQWQVLGALSSHTEGLNQNEIATLTFKDKHSVSRMLDRLERAGWVVRRPHPLDARAYRAILGRRGGELATVKAALRTHFSRINGLLSESQRQELLGLLRILRAGLEK